MQNSAEFWLQKNPPPPKKPDEKQALTNKVANSNFDIEFWSALCLWEAIILDNGVSTLYYRKLFVNAFENHIRWIRWYINWEHNYAQREFSGWEFSNETQTWGS